MASATARRRGRASRRGRGVIVISIWLRPAQSTIDVIASARSEVAAAGRCRSESGNGILGVTAGPSSHRFVDSRPTRASGTSTGRLGQRQSRTGHHVRRGTSDLSAGPRSMRPRVRGAVRGGP